MENTNPLKTDDADRRSKSSMTGPLFRFLTHSAWLVVASLASIVLWMPFGLGYYDFPWEQPIPVYLLLAFVMVFPASAAVALNRSWHPQFSPLRFATSALSLVIGLHGLVHILHWWFRFWLRPD